jgi:UDP-glucose 4-epimerase
VILYESLVGGPRAEASAARLQAEGATLIRGDIRDAERLAEVLRPGDGLVHLAAMTSVPVSIELPGVCHAVNVEGTRCLLAAAERARVRRVVFASTAAVYGPEPSLPSHEGDTPAPASPYGASKLQGEIDMASSSVNTVALRLFNVYGPGQDPQSSYSGVITRWVNALRRGASLDLYGDGTQTRDFIHVEDVATALSAALEADGADRLPINVGSGEAVSLARLVQILGEVLGVEPVVQRHAVRAGDVQHSRADIRRARTLLAFSPRVELREGLRGLIDE